MADTHDPCLKVYCKGIYISLFLCPCFIFEIMLEQIQFLNTWYSFELKRMEEISWHFPFSEIL